MTPQRIKPSRLTDHRGSMWLTKSLKTLLDLSLKPSKAIGAGQRGSASFTGFTALGTPYDALHRPHSKSPPV